ncbi:MAG: HAMP domain-containing histidine kinase [Alphaproteobacteria bacterium]|nr:HAMP domain-containing histidine kinase [Alphaproteobacteria bacterium]
MVADLGASRTAGEYLGGVRGFAASLRGRLLFLTVFFVMLAEVLVYVPSIALQRERLLEMRLEMAQLAALTREATMGEEVSDALEAELLNNAGVLTVSLKRDDARELMLSVADPPPVDLVVMLGAASPFALAADAFGTLAAPSGRILYVKGYPVKGGGTMIEFTLPERDLRVALFAYSRNILFLSLFISTLTGILVFASLDRLFLKPVQRLVSAMMRFREKPSDATRILVPSGRSGEIGEAERALAAMERDVHASLQHKSRLAALGEAVAKINHDLRNILASSRLISDRLLESPDPMTARLAARLTAAIGRAIDLATNILKYGRAEEAPPVPRTLDLHRLVEEVRVSLDAPEAGPLALVNEVAPATEIVADPDQLFRVLLNLARNALEAVAAGGRAEGRVALAARRSGEAVEIFVRDTGPGISAELAARLFQPFIGSARAGGSGLGLAIARELVEAHGGTLELDETGPEGTSFRILLPQNGAPQPRAQEGAA